MKKVITLTIAALLLTGCSSSNEIQEISDIQDRLASTSWACEDWEEYEPGVAATCGLPHNQGTVWVRMTDDPEMLSAVSFDHHSTMAAAIVGDNWVYQCGAPLSVGDCEHIAGLVDGEVIERGHWSE